MMKEYKRQVLLTVLLITTLINIHAGDNTLRIYIDADWTGAYSSSRSIEQGVQLALSEINSKMDGYEIEVIRKDHHGNSRRSSLHINEFISDPAGLVMFSGLHSPPVLTNMELIQDSDVLFLDPWAAARPITRKPGKDGDNWVFRLSIDDTKAGDVLVHHACDGEGYKKPALLLEDTAWGRSNERTINAALAGRRLSSAGTFWFDWNTGKIGASEILQDIYSSGADLIFFVANSPEGKTFLRAMAERNESDRLPIRSHWGITGGDLFEVLGPDILVEKVDLKFLQTSFSFVSSEQTAFSRGVFTKLRSQFPEIRNPGDLQAPTGFIHAYDLTRILIEAMKNVDLDADIKQVRDKIRSGLENLNKPVEGLIKTYIRPFSVYSAENDSAHEALSFSDFTLAFYDEDGGIHLIGSR